MLNLPWPTSLQIYCESVDFVFVFGAGTTEAFLHAVANETQLKRSNDSLLVFSLIYLVLNVSLIRSAGAIGLILANSLSILSWHIKDLYFFFSWNFEMFALFKEIDDHFSYCRSWFRNKARFYSLVLSRR